VIASHYAEPVQQTIGVPAMLHSLPADNGDVICELEPSEPFALLDDSLGWAWGYAGRKRRVGYVRSSALA
jgi:hypothetical protein